MAQTSENSSESGSIHGRTIRRFAFRMQGLLVIKYLLSLVTMWLFAWGTIGLALRAAAGTSTRILLWGALALIPIFLCALILGRRRMPSQATVRAVLDWQSGCGGLLMAEEQTDMGDWVERMPAIVAPRLRWKGRRASGLFLSAAVFVAISFIVPVRFAAMTEDRPLDIAREAEKLAEEIEALKKEDIIEEAKADSLEQKLAEIRSDASGEDPAKTWEALDHLQDAVEKTTLEATEKMAANSERLGQAEALSKALTDEGGAMDSKLMTEAMKELSDLTQSAAAASDLADSGLSQETLDALKAGSLSKEQLKQLSAALGKSKGKLSERLAKLRDAGLIDLKTLKQCENAGKCDSAGLAAFLAENAGDTSVADLVGAWSAPGRGGVSRGRGDAPMTWSDGTSERGAKFKEQVLSPSVLAGLKDSQLVGRSVGAPSVEKTGAARSGALSGASSGGGSAFTQSVLPRHKGAVKRYFERH
jgi:DNA-binding transcriptional ArsR family regulator